MAVVAPKLVRLMPQRSLLVVEMDSARQSGEKFADDLQRATRRQQIAGHQRENDQGNPILVPPVREKQAGNQRG